MRLTRCRSAGRNATVFTYLCSEPLHKRSRVQIEQRSGADASVQNIDGRQSLENYGEKGRRKCTDPSKKVGGPRKAVYAPPKELPRWAWCGGLVLDPQNPPI